MTEVVATHDQALHAGEASWQRLIDMTAGDALACYQCGSCSSICPWSIISDQLLSPRHLMRLSQLGLAQSTDSLWLCTDCRQCVAVCPREVPIPDIIRTLRSRSWEEMKVPNGLPTVLWSIFWNNNPWSQPPSLRARWADNFDVPIFDPDLHEYLLFIGCTSAYDRRLSQVARAVVKLLKEADIPFGILGEEEPCCGEAALSVGHRSFFDDLILQATQSFASINVRKIVMLSAHCYDALKNNYPQKIDSWVEIIHYTELLNDLADRGKLAFKNPLDIKITYHDPCLLARSNPLSDAPRHLLSLVLDSELMEMPRSRESTLCCGGGGGRMWLETEAGHRLSDLRVSEAVETGAEVLVTACPYCLSTLEDSVKSSPSNKLRILDIAEICLMGLNDDE